MVAFPEVYKSLMPFLKIARDMSYSNVVCEYWCLKYVLAQIQKMEHNSDECEQFVSSLMLHMQKLVNNNSDILLLDYEAVGKKHLRSAALDVFQYADFCDRSGKFSIDLLKSYIRCAYLITVFDVFNKTPELLIEARNHSILRATYLFTCFKNGVRPKPSVIENVELAEACGNGEVQIVKGPCEFDNFIRTGREFVFPLHFMDENDQLVQRFQDFNVAYKLCGFAINALQNDNAEDVIRNIEGALKIMKHYKKK
ncbi:Vacuolar protein sorting-associated protein VTA1 -like protein [Trichinella britovi]|uniref:Vacuolar protein sorting-associated protein VTA1-like protein n=1 Tax=Trichinella britovi TaxID=45882 RepID=A0A0V1C8L0_TRIBR|nr:Vacuolar protein sorting-associated protein VTA1 -like protein [Trichinella britovi]